MITIAHYALVSAGLLVGMYGLFFGVWAAVWVVAAIVAVCQGDKPPAPPSDPLAAAQAELLAKGHCVRLPDGRLAWKDGIVRK